MSWTNSYTGEEIASAALHRTWKAQHEGWLRIQMGDMEQTIILTPKPESLVATNGISSAR